MISGKSIALGVYLCNEENTFLEMWECIKSFIDEINVIIDDATTDGTEKMIRSLGGRTVTRHLDGFAEWQTELIRMARTDWTFKLDPDERILLHELAGLERLVSDPAVDLWYLSRRHYLDMEMINQVYIDCYPNYQPRLISTKNPEIKFVRRVHEYPVGAKKVGFSEVPTIRHFGKTSSFHRGLENGTRENSFGALEVLDRKEHPENWPK